MILRPQDRLFGGRLDAAPFAGVFFCLLILLMVGQSLNNPGVRVHLPSAEGLPGSGGPSIAVALDSAGRLYFEGQIIGADELRSRLKEAVKKSPAPLTLVVEADAAADYGALVELSTLARSAGIREALLATLPRSAASAP
jgi:biopolymer transport protein ExbD